MSDVVPVVTVDGPGGSGKGTVAQGLAERLGWRLLDSGAIYRVLAAAALKSGTELDDESALVRLTGTLDCRFQPIAGAGVDVYLGGEDVSREVRGERCGSDASRLAALPGVRQALLARQRAFRKPPGLVADGRDMGSVVFPDAQAKIFLTASPEERARRRHKQLSEKGIDANLGALITEIGERDRRDQDRVASPLRPATDAVVIDTTDHNIGEVLARVARELAARGIAVS